MSRVAVRAPEELKIMRQAGAIVAETLALLSERTVPGITTKDLDELARQEVSRRGARPSFPDVMHPDLGTPFPGAICTSVNDEIVHGIPSDRVLEDGDIVSIDLGVLYRGFHADSATTAWAGRLSLEARRLMEGTQEALTRGIDQVQPGRRLQDISVAIESYAAAKGLSVVRQYVGHGIGRSMHEPPQVPNYRTTKKGPILRPGWALAIEPMLNLGGEATRVLDDKWTVATADGSLSAHFEHTVAVTRRGHWILTVPDGTANGNVR
jgi:methionyl aminopeptidase